MGKKLSRSYLTPKYLPLNSINLKFCKPVIIKNQSIMKNNKLTTALTVLGLFCVNLLLAQTSISGTVTDAETNEPIPGVNILIQGTSEGTNTDFDGNFTLSSDQAAPFTVVISSIGFSSQSIEVTSSDQVINVSLPALEDKMKSSFLLHVVHKKYKMLPHRLVLFLQKILKTRQ